MPSLAQVYLALPCRYLAYLEAAARLASEQWTQFGHVSMVAGIALLTAALLLHAAAALGGTGAQPAPVSSGSQPSSSCRKAGPHLSLVLRMLAVLSQSGLVWRPAEERWPAPSMKGTLAALVMVHVLGIFSCFFLLSEGEAAGRGYFVPFVCQHDAPESSRDFTAQSRA